MIRCFQIINNICFLIGILTLNIYHIFQIFPKQSKEIHFYSNNIFIKIEGLVIWQNIHLIQRKDSDNIIVALLSNFICFNLLFFHLPTKLSKI